MIRQTAPDELAAVNAMHDGRGFPEIARLPRILGAQANRASPVLFRAVRPTEFGP
jgi:hypothetical protein